MPRYLRIHKVAKGKFIYILKLSKASWETPHVSRVHQTRGTPNESLGPGFHSYAATECFVSLKILSHSSLDNFLSKFNFYCVSDLSERKAYNPFTRIANN